MPLNTIKSTLLDIFLRDLKAEPKEIYFKTSISIAKLSHLRTNRVNLYVYDFFLIGKSLDTDFNEMAKKVFNDYEADIALMLQPKEPRKRGKLGKFGEFIEKYLNSQSSLANAIGIDKHRFGRLMYSDSELIAVDLYVITKFLGQDFKTVIESICAHLRLNPEEEQQRLKSKYQAELDMKKAKRDAEKAKEAE